MNIDFGNNDNAVIINIDKDIIDIDIIDKDILDNDIIDNDIIDKDIIDKDIIDKDIIDKDIIDKDIIDKDIIDKDNVEFQNENIKLENIKLENTLKEKIDNYDPSKILDNMIHIRKKVDRKSKELIDNITSIIRMFSSKYGSFKMTDDLESEHIYFRINGINIKVHKKNICVGGEYYPSKYIVPKILLENRKYLLSGLENRYEIKKICLEIILYGYSIRDTINDKIIEILKTLYYIYILYEDSIYTNIFYYIKDCFCCKLYNNIKTRHFSKFIYPNPDLIFYSNKEIYNRDKNKTYLFITTKKIYMRSLIKL